MKYYFAGGEVPSHRKVLHEVGAQHIALSYMGLRRKVKFARPWIIADKFDDDVDLFLDSGAYTVNRGSGDAYSQRDLSEISDHYQSFVKQNIDRLTMVSEFDSLALGSAWVRDQRDSFYDHLPRDKFLPLWHPEWGLDLLSKMASEYPRIGVSATDMNGRDLTPVLNQIAARGVSLHGVAMTSVDHMRNILWDSVSSTSWISPQQYGDTIVWTGRELKRYPKKQKDQARKRYRTLFDKHGFDAEKIAADDSTEVLRLSIWSWQKLVDDIEHKRGNGPEVATTFDMEDTPPFTETEQGLVDTETGEVRNSVSTTPEVTRRRETVPLPLLGVTKRTEEYLDDKGETRTREVADVRVRSESERKCVSCYLASKCPAFDAGSNCAFDIPIEIKTRDQFVNVQNSLIEMQAQRVFFMRFAEEQEGGYADPNLSQEMDRLQKMLKTKNDMEQEGFSFKIEGKSVGGQQGQPGMLARLFGEAASEKARALPEAMTVEQVMDIADADLIEGDR